MKSLVGCFVFLILISCSPDRTRKEKILKNEQPLKSTVPFSVIDSLNKYSAADSVLIVDDSTEAVLFIGKANEISFGVLACPDSLLKFYQNVSNKWEAIDSFEYNLAVSFIDRKDLNGDKKSDVKISTLSGSAGNTENVVFLFDSKSKKFKRNKYYEMSNVEYDSISHFVRSSWFAGAVHCQTKYKYKITGDSLKLVLAASYCPDEKSMRETGVLEITKPQGNKEVVLRTVKGKSEKVWNEFEHTFWDSSESFEN